MTRALAPFGWVAEGARPRLLAALTAMVAVLSAWLWHLDQALVTSEAPRGIVSFELARHLDRSAAILASWSPRVRATALLIQGVDFLYLCVYPAWLSLASARLGAGLGPGWQRSASAVSSLVLGCIPLDALENHALIQQLMHGPSEFHAQLAWWCAVPKFALVGVAAAFLLLAGLASLRQGIRGAATRG